MTLRPRDGSEIGRTGRERKAEHLLERLARTQRHTGEADCLCVDCVTAALAAEEAKQTREMKRVNWLPAPQYFNLNHACWIVNKAFNSYGCYLVGSATIRRDYRDVDVRLIMSDEEFERLFPGANDRPDLNATWALMCSAISLFLQVHSKLPVDFQIQSQKISGDFSRKDGHDRQPLGIFLFPTPRDYATDAQLSATNE